MASFMIHYAIAHEINKKLCLSNNFLLGSIAPDIAKLTGKHKSETHFVENKDSDIPILDDFLNKYNNYLDDEFVLGYYLHLYVDYLWFKYFITEITDNIYVTKLSGEKIKLNGDMLKLYIYNDYTNMNLQILIKYKLSTNSLKITNPKPIIEEIDYSKLYILTDKFDEIMINTKHNKEFVFNIENISNFIDTSTNLIIDEIEKLRSKS